jgi:hypothetical protein
VWTAAWAATRARRTGASSDCRVVEEGARVIGREGQLEKQKAHPGRIALRHLVYLAIVFSPYLPAMAFKWLDGREPYKEHVAWELVKVAEYAPLVSAIFFAVMLLWLLRRTPPEGLGLFVGLALPLTLIAAPCFYVFAVFELFGENMVHRADAPDGSSVAYVYRAGLFCDHSIYLRPRGSIMATRFGTTTWVCKMPDGSTVDPIVSWNPSTHEPQVVNHDGTPVPLTTSWLPFFPVH